MDSKPIKIEEPSSQTPEEDEKDREIARPRAQVEAQAREIWVRDAHIRYMEQDLENERRKSRILTLTPLIRPIRRLNLCCLSLS